MDIVYLVTAMDSSKHDDDFMDDAMDLMLLKLLNDYHASYICKQPCRDGMLTGPEWVQEVLQGHSNRCYDVGRMEKHVFLNLCNTLKRRNFLEDTNMLL